MTEMKKLDVNESMQQENKQPKDSEQSQVTEPKWPASFQLPRVILCGVDWGSRD